MLSRKDGRVKKDVEIEGIFSLLVHLIHIPIVFSPDLSNRIRFCKGCGGTS